ncbi:DUF6094 domain-containing protein [Candidatus Leptofilum sp.]|uniref:DUF6094 domain-containing protein n=1 Tax=Candidatus Leptofilum sp. TaxID=3241576 RepID=UPI003B5B5443
MTRLANVEKAGYFRLPPSVTERLVTHIAAPKDGRILDPCAGEGSALVTLAKKLHLDPFGVELHEGRAKAAREAVGQLLVTRHGFDKGDAAASHGTRILHDSYLSLVTSRGGYNLLYLNPPYDHDDVDGRLEYQWLVHTRPWLQPSGLLVWVVPQHMLRFRKATRYILSWYDRVKVFRFPDEEYDRFKQIVLFGVLRPKAITPESEIVEKLARQAVGKEMLPPLTAVSEPLYSLPPLAVKHGAFKFRSQFVDPADALAEARQLGASTKDAWHEHLDPDGANVPLRPLTPLKIGHMNSVIAAGHLNNQVLADDDERLLIKGRNYKVTRAEEYEEPLPDGRTRVTHLETESVVTDITTVDSNGQVTSYKGAELEQFLQKWISHLTRIVAQEYPPVYQFDLNGYGRLLNSLSKKRKIPGMNGKSGLLPAQKHAAAAILTRLETYPEAIAIGEMGTGKTTISAAIAAGLSAGRTIVLCPPHLVDKWQREFKAVWPGVRTMHLQTISDVDQFFGDQPDDAPLVGVLKQTTARSASGWEHAYDYGGPASHNYGSKGYSDIERPWGNVISARKLMDLPVEERPFTEKQILALQQRGVRCPVCGETQFRGGRPLAVKELKTATWTCSNEACRSPLYQFTRRRSESQVRGNFKLYAQRERLIRSYTDKGQPVPFHELEKWHGTAVRDTFGYGKIPLAGYIKKRGKGKLDLLLVDEVHQYKGFDSDQGYAMHHLAQAAEKVVALTGTIYGGKASSLFYLLFRLASEMGKTYVDPEANGQRRLRSRDWVSAYGILQRIETVTLDEDGRQTANSRSNVRFKELPGGSPAMLPWLLNRSVFLSLGDMGFPLPAYTEIPVSVSMAPEQAVRYESLKEQLKEELKERLIRGDKSLLAGYLYALLFWPDSPRRAKVVECPRTGTVVASVPGLSDDFVGPKEEEIIELCLQEKAQGRRVLLLCQQTDTLDIQPEWKAMLEAAGLKATILRAAPNQREKWVEKQVKAGADVIITHPRKVETGIDLLDFPTIVWMAIDYSVYTVLQASRRSWRIGQTEPVKVYFFAYEETIQEDALRLVAAKVAAALRVNGDTVGDDSLAELDDLTSGDLVATLAKIITGDVQIDAHSLQQAFAEANASLRQANTIIGDYQMVEEETDEEAAVVINGNGHLSQRPLLVPDRLIVTNGDSGRSPQQASHFTNGHSPIGNGHSHGHGQEKPNGVAVISTHLNGKQAKHDESDEAHEPADLHKSAPPPVPRPRLLLSQLSV